MKQETNQQKLRWQQHQNQLRNDWKRSMKINMHIKHHRVLLTSWQYRKVLKRTIENNLWRTSTWSERNPNRSKNFSNSFHQSIQYTPSMWSKSISLISNRKNVLQMIKQMPFTSTLRIGSRRIATSKTSIMHRHLFSDERNLIRNSLLTSNRANFSQSFNKNHVRNKTIRSQFQYQRVSASFKMVT